MLGRLSHRRGVSLSLVGLLIVCLIIAYLFIKALTSYLGSSIKGSEEVADQTGGLTLLPSATSGPTVHGATSSPVVQGATSGSTVQAQGVLDWTRQKVKDAEKIAAEREKNFAEMQF